jgi:methionyl-tRNA formyltransferase
VGKVTPPASLRLVFAGTSAFAVPVLQALAENNYPIAAVVTQPDRPAGRGQTLQPPPVKLKALELGLPVYQPVTLKNDEARNLFNTLAPELLVVVAYGKLLPPWLLALPRYGAVNLHGSLLPKYRGAAPIQWAVASGDSETGVCTMRLDEGLDTGPVYACEKTPIDPDESIQRLSSRLADLGSDLMIRTIEGILAATLQPVPQDHARATFAPILTKEDGVVDWRRPANAIHNRIRAFNPWPGTRTQFRGETCKVLRSRVRADMSRDTPGTLVCGVTGERFLAVVCGDGVLLELLELQLPNRKSQSGMDFVNGLRVVAGEKLGASDGPVG